MKKFTRILSAWMIVLAITGTSLAANEVHHVNKNNSSPGNGQSWATAFNTIAEAIAEAEATDQIWVAGDEAPTPIVYVEEAAITILDGVRLYGGFPPSGNPGFNDRNPARYVTIISGDADDDDAPGFVNRDDNHATLISIDWFATPDTLVSGFTVRGAIVQAIEVGAFAEPQFDSLSVIDNGNSTPTVGGAGVACASGSAPTFEDCRFEGNRATHGAAINGGLMTAVRCEFIDNVSTDGSGGAVVCGGGTVARLDPEDMENWPTTPTPEFRQCRFEGNVAAENGGAVSFGGQLRLIASTFKGNSSADHGGAIAFTYGSLLGLNLYIHNNTTVLKGGAIYNDRGCFVTLINTLAHDNEATSIIGDGGVMWLDLASTVFLQNVTFARNRAPSNPAFFVGLGNACDVDDEGEPIEETELFVRMKNSIVWDHVYPSMNESQFIADFAFNDLDIGAIGTGGISADPRFVDPGNDNFRLLSCSPAIDAADTRIVPEDLFDVDADEQTDCDGCDATDDGEFMPDLDRRLRVADRVATTDTGEEAIIDCPRSCEKVVDMGAYEFAYGDCAAMGDMNADGLVNGLDIQPFTHCAINSDESGLSCVCGDFTADYRVDALDIPCFIEMLLTGAHGCGSQDECGTSGGWAAMSDCNDNDIPDANDIASGTSLDCNKNGVPDECDISTETSNDANANDIPDECETDCNNNGVPDDWDISEETSNDVNANDIPDECEPDCNGNDVPDDHDVATSASDDCNENGVPDECEEDCNGNDVPDDCDIADSTSEDCNENGIPDECDLSRSMLASFDCNGNDIPDECDIASSTSEDCNENGIPDECDIANSISEDENENDIPDECEEESFMFGGENFMMGGEGGGEFDADAAWATFYEWLDQQVFGTPGDWHTLSGPQRFERVMDELRILGLPLAAPW